MYNKNVLKFNKNAEALIMLTNYKLLKINRLQMKRFEL